MATWIAWANDLMVTPSSKSISGNYNQYCKTTMNDGKNVFGTTSGTSRTLSKIEIFKINY